MRKLKNLSVPSMVKIKQPWQTGKPRKESTEKYSPNKPIKESRSRESNDLKHFEMTEKAEQDVRRISCLMKGTRLERGLCFITVISLFMVVVMVVVLAHFGYLYNNKIDLCLTPGCVKTAAVLLTSMDENIDPCSDFYRFACGGWLKKESMPEEETYYSTFHEAVDNLNLQLKSLLEEKLDGTEPSFIIMTKQVYDTCIDLETIETTGAEPLINVLKSLAGWPVVEGNNWSRRKFDWVGAVKSLRNLGYNHDTLLNVYVTVDDRSNDRYTIKLDQPSFGMPDRTYLISGLKDTSTAAYYRQMVKAAILLGADKATAERELLEALKFEMTLANYSLPREEKRDITKSYNKYTIKELQDMAPQIPWHKYISGLVSDGIYENETVIVVVPEFIKKFAALIPSVDKRVIANYMLWRVVDQSLPLLSKEWRDINLEYRKVLTGKSREKPRWKECLSKLTKYHGSLGIALSSYYVRHYFKEETKHEVSELVKYVHKELLRILEEIDWMDEETKLHAKAKAYNMIFSVGYPDELLNNTAVMEHYQTLTVSNDSYFENYLRLEKWSTDNKFSKLRKQNLRKDWKKYAMITLVNAFYHPPENAIDLPAGILQIPFFNNDRPNYINFASIGTTVGHEITHGFDDQGRQYDKDGNNMNWWDKTTEEHFRKKIRCIVDQYSNYTAENGMKLNGANTQGENIADNGGFKESYRAYQSWVKDNGPEKLLPGLKYNQNQLFWIGSAYEWCAKFRPENLKRIILSNEHSPDEFRVIGPLSNLPEFSSDFNCPLDSPMNKRHKCKVW